MAKKLHKSRAERIAREYLYIKTLDYQGNDSLDNHEVNVKAIKLALQAAYEAGLNHGRPALALKEDEIVEELEHALRTDGGHHKQHDLEVVLRLIKGDDYVDGICNGEHGWDQGIPS